MPKVADILLKWKRSASADINRRVITINRNGETTTADLPAEVSEYALEVPANSSVSFKTTVYDAEGGMVESTTYSFTLGDLEAPLPDTELTHEVVGVRDAVINSRPPMTAADRAKGGR